METFVANATRVYSLVDMRVARSIRSAAGVSGTGPVHFRCAQATPDMLRPLPWGWPRHTQRARAKDGGGCSPTKPVSDGHVAAEHQTGRHAVLDLGTAVTSDRRRRLARARTALAAGNSWLSLRPIAPESRDTCLAARRPALRPVAGYSIRNPRQLDDVDPSIS
jgi:hypothetical protein